MNSRRNKMEGMKRERLRVLTGYAIIEDYVLLDDLGRRASNREGRLDDEIVDFSKEATLLTYSDWWLELRCRPIRSRT